jgi:ribonucleoside-triphosphate reductase
VERYTEIITAVTSSDGEPYYTNSSHLSVGYTEDIFAALDIQDKLQTLYTSGTVFHAYLGEKMPTWQSAAALVRAIAENYKLPYYTLSPTYSVCENHGYIVGEHFNCPKCNRKAEVYSRITGYYRPVQNWNNGKTQEYKERKTYDVINSASGDNNDEKTAASPKKTDFASKTKIEPPQESLFFITKTCPNCKIAKRFLDDCNVNHTTVDADENEQLVKKYDVRRAPTLIVIKGGNTVAYTNASDIRKYAESGTAR